MRRLAQPPAALWTQWVDKSIPLVCPPTQDDAIPFDVGPKRKRDVAFRKQILQWLPDLRQIPTCVTHPRPWKEQFVFELRGLPDAL